MTVDDVAAESGVSKGTVYATFPSRQALVDAMVIGFLDESERRYRAALETLPAWDALVESVLTPTIGLATTAEMMAPDAPEGPVDEAYRRGRAVLEEIFEKGKREGSIRPEITAGHWIVLSRGLYQILPEGSLERAAQLRECMAIVLRGFHTEPFT